MEKKANKIELPKISKHDFYFETSLYNTITIKELEEDILKWEIKGYNPFEQFETTFSINSDYRIYFEKNQVEERFKIGQFNWFITVGLDCKRASNQLTFYLSIVGDKITKIWQYPSLVDIQFAGLDKKYNKVLPEEDLQDFKKAIWLYTHGAWAWSFVYLRRIFERLIFDTYNTNKKSLWIEEAEFTKKRVNDKIELLKEFLPEQLIEMKSIYWILSKWVHELPEDQCKQYFNPIKLSIELILDQKIEIQIKKEKDKKVKQELQKINKEISK
jgi:hypothetical protein